MVANLIPYKGHADLIEALSLIQTTMPAGWRLWCVGRDDGIQAKLTEKAKSLGIDDAIHFLGSRDDIPALLHQADLVVHCSHEEGFSNAILEAMSAGKACIVTNVGGNAEAIKHAQSGWVVPKQNPEQLAEAILTLSRNQSLREQYANKARERYQTCFTLPACVEAYSALYLSLLTEKSKLIA